MHHAWTASHLDHRVTAPNGPHREWTESVWLGLLALAPCGNLQQQHLQIAVSINDTCGKFAIHVINTGGK
jgi:hypothetical protein